MIMITELPDSSSKEEQDSVEETSQHSTGSCDIDATRVQVGIYITRPILSALFEDA